jgi:hypothetical protein
MFFLDRAKTGRAAAGTLTAWSEQILETYMTMTNKPSSPSVTPSFEKNARLARWKAG